MSFSNNFWKNDNIFISKCVVGVLGLSAITSKHILSLSSFNIEKVAKKVIKVVEFGYKYDYS